MNHNLKAGDSYVPFWFLGNITHHGYTKLILAGFETTEDTHAVSEVTLWSAQYNLCDVGICS